MVNTNTPIDLISPALAAKLLDAVPVTEDVVEYTIACALALSPPEVRTKIRQHIAQHASAQARRIFGGDRVYISRQEGQGRSIRNETIRRQFQKGEHIAYLSRHHNLSERQIWRVITGK